MRKDELRDGMPVWYSPSKPSAVQFRGIVDGAPFQVGSRWCVNLREMPTAYGAWRNNPSITRVTAAALTHLSKAALR